MAVALANKENGVKTSNGWSTASLSFTGGSRGLISVSSATSGGAVSAHGATGGGVTWSEIGTVAYSSRRRISWLLSDGTPSGVITVTATATGTYQESQYSVEELTGYDSASVHGTVGTVGNGGGVSSPVNLGSLGTIDAGDLVIAAFGHEDASNTLAAGSGSTQHVLRDGGGNVRALIVMTSTTDDTPGITYNAVSGSGGVGAIFNVGAGGGGSQIKTISGLAIASVKTVQGLAIASNKTILGVTNV